MAGLIPTIYNMFQPTEAERRAEFSQSLFGSPTRVEGTMQSQEFDEAGNPIDQRATVQQPRYEGTGLFQNLSQEQIPQMQAIKQMVGSTNANIQKTGLSMLEDMQGGDGMPTAADYLGARVSAYGAPEKIVDGKNINAGKMQRGIVDASGNIDWKGTAYDPRNPFVNTGTELTSTYGTQEDIPINLQAAEEQKQLGKSGILSRFKQIDELKATEGGRAAGMKKAKYFYEKLKGGKMSSGGMRMMLSYLPFTFTEQGRMDEEFNAFAETAARQALKASGEIRPTDADVTGMKKAMFGIGRDEQVNIRLLQNFMESIKRDDHRAYLVESAKQYKKSKENVSPSGVSFTVK